MTVDKIQKGLINFIDGEIVPKSDMKEKIAIAGLSGLGMLNVDKYIDDALKSPFMKNSNIWTDESKKDFSLDNIKKVAYEFIGMLPEKKFKYAGYKINLPFYQDTLFGGFVIDKNTIDKLFDYIEKA